MDATEARSANNVLLLASAFGAPYRVLRSAAALPAAVHVLGCGTARSLRLSRFCRSYRYFPFEEFKDDAADLVAAAAYIDGYARARNISRIFPADALTTRFLIRLRPLLTTPCFPLPDLAAFDALATKDRFGAFCREEDLAHPREEVFASREDLLAALQTGRLRFPAVFKPLDRAGSIGVRIVDKQNAYEAALSIDYAPVLVQDFVEGEDRSITVFCREGHVLRQAVYCHPNGDFRFLREIGFERLVARIAYRLKLTGVFNFDARVDHGGKTWLIECNPRFFFNMDVATVVGMNFADTEAVEPKSIPDCDICIPDALLAQLLRGRSPRRQDWRMLRHWLKDPLVFALVSCGYQRKWNASWLEDALVATRQADAPLLHARAMAVLG